MCPPRNAVPLCRHSARAQGATDPLAEPTFVFDPAAPGQTGTATLLSLTSSLHDAVLSLQRAQDPANALTAYRLSYETAPTKITADLPSPERLQGQPLSAAPAW